MDGGPIYAEHGVVKVRPVYFVSWKSVVMRDPCPYCCVAPRADFGKSRMTLEHVLPLSKGGMNGWSNLVAAHAGCNQHKGNRSLVQFIAFRLACTGLSKKARRGIRRTWFNHEGIEP